MTFDPKITSDVQDKALPTIKQRDAGNFMARPVQWMREPSASFGTSILKVAAIFTLFLLTLAVIGLIFVIPGVIEWKRQSNQTPLISLPSSTKQTSTKQKEDLGTRELMLGEIKVSILPGDLLKQNVDVIVNAAGQKLQGGGGIDQQIEKKAGKGIYSECSKLLKNIGSDEAKTGQAFITSSGELSQNKETDKVKHIIHTLGPKERDSNRRNLLRHSYYNSLTLAHEHMLSSIAIPAISVGIFAYPAEEAAEVALNTVKEFCKNYPDTTLKDIRLVFWNDISGRTAHKKIVELVDGMKPSSIAKEIKEKEIVIPQNIKSILNQLISNGVDSLPIYEGQKETFSEVTAPLMKGVFLENGSPFIVIKLFNQEILDQNEQDVPLVMSAYDHFVVLYKSIEPGNENWLGKSIAGKGVPKSPFFKEPYIVINNEGLVPEQLEGFNLLKNLIANGKGEDLIGVPTRLSGEVGA